TLDAMIIDGAHSDMGAVGCLRRIRSAISVARAVMEHTSQSILVGEKATAFAVMAGFPEEALESDFSDALHSSWREAKCQPNFYRAFPLSDESCPPYRLPDSNMVRGLDGGLRERETLDVRTKTRQSGKDGSQTSREENLRVSRDNHDTIGMIAIDKLGNLAAGTSTNGANHKVAGRVGDAAVPGAGAYVDNDVGAATGTGDGDIMMRFLPAFQAVNYMREGLPPTLACEKALVPIALKFPAFKGALVCVSKDGRHGAAAHGWVFHYSFQDPSLAEPQVVEVTPS
ncbi:MAG: N(4)-(beta-N-acetylglucosaminyl)-L-asparaginase, partial [Promethearchaeia archaeon]